MKLLCLGDIGLVDNGLSNKVWPYPIKITSEEEARVLFNWELPVGEKTNPIPRKCGGPRLLSFPTSPEVIRGWAPGFAALATNHILDAEERGLVDTLASLSRMGFLTTGAGRSSEEICKPLLWETKEGTLAIINWVFPETNPDWMTIPGPNCWPGIDEAKNILRRLKQENDWVMVLAHWGDELFPYPRLTDRAIAQELANAGLDIFVGHHPHVVRGMEVINGCPVYYSIGNFFFSDIPGNDTLRWAPRNREALGIQISFKRGMRPEIKCLSFWQENDQVVDDLHRRAVKRMSDTSRPLKQYSGADYERWYFSRREMFDKYWAKWHFGVRRLGFWGSVRRISGF